METLCCRRSWLGAVLGHFISEIIFPVQSFAVRSVGNFWGLEIGKNIAWGCRVFRRVCRWSTAALISIVELLWDPRRFRSVSTGLYPKSTKGLSWTVLFSHWWIFGDRFVISCVFMRVYADWCRLDTNPTQFPTTDAPHLESRLLYSDQRLTRNQS